MPTLPENPNQFEPPDPADDPGSTLPDLDDPAPPTPNGQGGNVLTTQQCAGLIQKIIA